MGNHHENLTANDIAAANAAAAAMLPRLRTTINPATGRSLYQELDPVTRENAEAMAADFRERNQ